MVIMTYLNIIYYCKYVPILYRDHNTFKPKLLFYFLNYGRFFNLLYTIYDIFQAIFQYNL